MFSESSSTTTRGKAALVTGATKGIGLALTHTLLKEGWIVFGVGRDENSLENTSQLFPAFIPIKADLTKNEDITRIAKVIADSKLSLQLCIQNAGMKTPPRPLQQHSCEAIDEVIALNLTAPMKLTSLLTPFMPPESRMLYITSRAATLQLKESSTYCASKAGLDQVAAIVRQELKDKNIGVATVIPGEVDTQIQQILRETKTFHLHRLFQAAHENKQLISPDVCAVFLKWLLCDLSFSDYKNSQMPLSIYDESHHSYWLPSKELLPAFPF